MTDRLFARIATAVAGLVLSFGALAAAGGPAVPMKDGPAAAT